MSNRPILLVYPPDHDDLPAVRRQARAALQAAGILPAWQEKLAGDPSLPRRSRTMAGPFLLIEGRTVAIGEVEQTAAVIRSVLEKSARRGWLRKPLALGSAVPGILMAFFPKCAACWAAYFSVLNSLGLNLPYMPWMKHVLAGSLVLSAVYFARVARRRKRWLPFGVQMAGFALVLAAQYLIESPGWMWTGIGLVFAGSLLHAMPDAWMRELERKVGIGVLDGAGQG